MPGPSITSYIRHYLGRALRETGQALDRVGARGQTHAIMKRETGDDPYVFHNIISRHRPRMELLLRGAPRVHKNTFIAPCSHLIGSVAVGEGTSVWYGAVLRADRCRNGLSAKDTREIRCSEDYFDENDDSVTDNEGMIGFGGGVINIGNNSNIQDGAIITARSGHTRIGNGVTIGHSAQIHSATVDSNSLIGMGAIILPGAHVESNAFVAAGAVVDKGTVVPSGELWVGKPAKKLRALSDKQIEKIKYQSSEYVKLSDTHLHVMDLGGIIGSYESSFVENFGQDNNIIKENLNANDVKGISCDSISKEDEQKQISA